MLVSRVGLTCRLWLSVAFFCLDVSGCGWLWMFARFINARLKILTLLCYDIEDHFDVAPTIPLAKATSIVKVHQFFCATKSLKNICEGEHFSVK